VWWDALLDCYADSDDPMTIDAEALAAAVRVVRAALTPKEAAL